MLQEKWPWTSHTMFNGGTIYYLSRERTGVNELKLLGLEPLEPQGDSPGCNRNHTIAGYAGGSLEALREAGLVHPAQKAKTCRR